MGQRCSALDADVSWKPTLQLSGCVCRHSDFKTFRTDVDEQEDCISHILENDGCSRDGLSKEAPATGLVRHVEHMVVPQGGVYTGQVLAGVQGDGQPHGVGTQRWPDGTVYTGNWMQGTAHGRGKLVKPDASGYEGSWVEGRKHGIGSEWMTDLSQYTGEFADGQKHGSGCFRWPGGASYTGEFCEDSLHGEGIFNWGDGRSYRGQWVQSRMHGQGRFEWPDGKSFEGKYEGDKKHGPGVFSWPDRSKCVGIWIQGKQHGIGTHVSSAGVARRGRWKHGNLEEWLEPLTQQAQQDVEPDGGKVPPPQADVGGAKQAAPRSTAATL